MLVILKIKKSQKENQDKSPICLNPANACKGRSGSRQSSMGLGPQKANPLLQLSALGRVQSPLKTQAIFIPKSPGSSPPCSRPWEPYNGEDSRKVLEWRMWSDLEKDPVHHPHHVNREIQAKMNNLQLKGKVCTREDYSPRPRQALNPLTQEHGALHMKFPLHLRM